MSTNSESPDCGNSGVHQTEGRRVHKSGEAQPDIGIQAIYRRTLRRSGWRRFDLWDRIQAALAANRLALPPLERIGILGETDDIPV